MILNGYNILTTVLVGLKVNDIEWLQYSHLCFNWTHRTHKLLNGCNILTSVLVGLTGYTNDIE